MVYDSTSTFIDFSGIRVFSDAEGNGLLNVVVQPDQTVLLGLWDLPPVQLDGDGNPLPNSDDAQALCQSVRELLDQSSEAGELEVSRQLPSGRLLNYNPTTGEFGIPGEVGLHSITQMVSACEGLIQFGRCTDTNPNA